MWTDNNGNPFEVNGIYRYAGTTWILKKIINNDLGLFQECHRKTFFPRDKEIDFLFTASFVRLDTARFDSNKEAKRLLEKEW